MSVCNLVLDDVFLPKDIDLDSTEMDETEREVEYFKRYVSQYLCQIMMGCCISKFYFFHDVSFDQLCYL